MSDAIARANGLLSDTKRELDAGFQLLDDLIEDNVGSLEKRKLLRGALHDIRSASTAYAYAMAGKATANAEAKLREFGATAIERPRADLEVVPVGEVRMFAHDMAGKFDTTDELDVAHDDDRAITTFDTKETP